MPRRAWHLVVELLGGLAPFCLESGVRIRPACCPRRTEDPFPEMRVATLSPSGGARRQEGLDGRLWASN